MCGFMFTLIHFTSSTLKCMKLGGPDTVSILLIILAIGCYIFGFVKFYLSSNLFYNFKRGFGDSKLAYYYYLVYCFLIVLSVIFLVLVPRVPVLALILLIAIIVFTITLKPYKYIG